jgi:hypothetical protein
MVGDGGRRAKSCWFAPKSPKNGMAFGARKAVAEYYLGMLHAFLCIYSRPGKVRRNLCVVRVWHGGIFCGHAGVHSEFSVVILRGTSGRHTIFE